MDEVQGAGLSDGKGCFTTPTFETAGSADPAVDLIRFVGRVFRPLLKQCEGAPFKLLFGEVGSSVR